MDLNRLWEQAADLLHLRQAEFHKDLQLSSEARTLLENPLLQRFFTETETSLLNQWKATNPGDIEAREEAYRLLYMLKKFRAYFEKFLASEQYAEQQLAEMETLP